MAIDPKVFSLLVALRNTTTQNKLRWEKTESSDTFEAWVGGNRILLKRGLDLNGDPYFDLIIPQYGQNVVETVMIDTGKEMELASELYFTARRIALGLDPILDQLLANIEAIGA